MTFEFSSNLCWTYTFCSCFETDGIDMCTRQLLLHNPVIPVLRKYPTSDLEQWPLCHVTNTFLSLVDFDNLTNLLGPLRKLWRSSRSPDRQPLPSHAESGSLRGSSGIRKTGHSLCQRNVRLAHTQTVSNAIVVIQFMDTRANVHTRQVIKNDKHKDSPWNGVLWKRIFNG